MGLCSDRWIIERCKGERGMIEPFTFGQVAKGAISYGVSSYGYDLRVGHHFKVFTDVRATVVDPKDLDSASMVDMEVRDFCCIPPNSFVLAESVETLRMPRDVTGLVLCKSTYIRAGVLIPTTVLEAGWEGTVTLEIANVTPLPARVYAGEGIAQVLFFKGDEPCEVSYADRKGKYQGQSGITLPRA